jgi:transposase
VSPAKDTVYRCLDSLDKQELTRTAFNFVSRRRQSVSLVFYDVTTLHFETETEDEFRRKGYSKNRRGDMPQIIVGLFVDAAGYPLDFDIFPGNTFEGHTLETAVAKLKHKYGLTNLTVVADAAMLSADNLSFLESQGFDYIVGARLKSLPQTMIREITAFDFSAGAIYSVEWEGKRLLVDFSISRAQRDAANRDRQVKKLEAALISKRPVIRKSKYLKLDSPGQTKQIDQVRIAADRQFDGLKGYITNIANRMTFKQIIGQYRNLWKIERAFRMSKSDLKERPVYHWLRSRIQAHLTLCFVSLLVAKETERILAQKHCSLDRAIEILGRVGSGTTRVGGVELDIESEPDEEARLILGLFEGH